MLRIVSEAATPALVKAVSTPAASFVYSACRVNTCRFAQTNLMRLRRQCEEHQESKDLRQQDQSTRVLVGALEGTSNEGAAGSSNGNSAEAGPRPSRQWWLDDDDEWGAGSLPLQLVPRSLDARPALTSAAHGGSAATAASTRGSSTTFRPRILSRQHREGSSASTSGAQSQHNHNNGIAAKPPNIMKRESGSESCLTRVDAAAG